MNQNSYYVYEIAWPDQDDENQEFYELLCGRCWFETGKPSYSDRYSKSNVPKNEKCNSCKRDLRYWEKIDK